MNQQVAPPIQVASPVVDRWIIRGAVQAESPLSIRTGLPEERKLVGAQENQADPAMDCEVYAVELDASDQPFIPATAFKSLVRRRALAIASQTDAAMQRLFGDKPERGRSKSNPDAQVAIGGRAEFRNLRCAQISDASPSVRGSTRIDESRRSALDGFLRHQRIVDRGASFKVEIVADGLGSSEIAILIAALRSLDGAGADSALGAGVGNGMGRVRWTEDAEEIVRLDATAIVDFIDGGLDWRVRAAQDDSHISELLRALPEWNDPNAPARIDMSIQIDGFFLVSQATEPKTKGDAQRGPISDSREWRAYLPGASLKGALRGQAMKIWRTVSGNMNQDAIPREVLWLFGGTDHAGHLKISDFTDDDARETRQVEMVAIDRLSGGAGEGKFAVRAFESPQLSGSITLPSTVSDELGRRAIGLLALTLRDLADGDVPLGYGTRKGFGASRLAAGDGESAITKLLVALGGVLNAADVEDARIKIESAVTAFRRASTTGRSNG